jgi:hypothetical protein
MGDMDGAIDLGALAKKDNLVVAVRPNIKIMSIKTEQGTAQVPVLQMEFKMLNGEVRKPLCFGPQLILPLIAMFSDYGVKAEGGVTPINEDGTPVDMSTFTEGSTNGG